MTKRGFIREGYFADLALVDLNSKWTATKDNLFCKCGWSSLEGTTFQTAINQTFVNGNLMYDNGRSTETIKGMEITITTESN
jgi:dihydroorotase